MRNLKEEIDHNLTWEEEEERPSRTQKKKDAQNLQKLGEFLVTMPKSEIERLDISQELKNAINIAKTFTKHGARKRQIQYIGVLMREVDTTALNAILEKIPHHKKL
ncbi:MAG: DUF615 domain-containing protein [Desulfamplus sp.]|nr:DUF615 domain-containing protein [Desulfamplus sp.]